MNWCRRLACWSSRSVALSMLQWINDICTHISFGSHDIACGPLRRHQGSKCSGCSSSWPLFAMSVDFMCEYCVDWFVSVLIHVQDHLADLWVNPWVNLWENTVWYGCSCYSNQKRSRTSTQMHWTYQKLLMHKFAHRCTHIFTHPCSSFVGLLACFVWHAALPSCAWMAGAVVLTRCVPCPLQSTWNSRTPYRETSWAPQRRKPVSNGLAQALDVLGGAAEFGRKDTSKMNCFH